MLMYYAFTPNSVFKSVCLLAQNLLDKPVCYTQIAAKSLQSCLTLCDPRDSSPPGSPIPGILQARTLEWVAISFSNAGKWKVKVKSLSRVWPSATHGLQPTRILRPWDFPGKSTGVGCHCLLHILRHCSPSLCKWNYLYGDLPFFKIQVNHFMAQDEPFGAKIILKCILWVRGLVPFWVLRHSFLSLTDC